MLIAIQAASGARNPHSCPDKAEYLSRCGFITFATVLVHTAALQLAQAFETSNSSGVDLHSRAATTEIALLQQSLDLPFVQQLQGVHLENVYCKALCEGCVGSWGRMRLSLLRPARDIIFGSSVWGDAFPIPSSK